MEFAKQLDCNQVIINGLTQIDIVRLYQFVCEYEKNVKDTPGEFDISYKGIEKIINKYDIYFDTCAKKNILKARRHTYYLLYEQTKNSKASKDDKVHHLLRHIRNSIAHGNLKKRCVKRNKIEVEIFEMIDKNLHRDTMWGEISVSVLYQLINELLKSKRKI